MNENVQAALRAWIEPDTWHTMQGEDEFSFYDFLVALRKETRKIDEYDLQDRIWQEVKARHTKFGDAPDLPPAESSTAGRVIRKCVSLAVNIFHYLDRADRVS